MKLLKKLNNKGFTLIEIIITVVILGIISGTIMDLYSDSQKGSMESRNIIDTQSKISTSIKLIIEDLREVESDKFKVDGVDTDSIEVFNENNIVLDNGIEGCGIFARKTIDTPVKIIAYKLDKTDANNMKIIRYKSDNITDIQRVIDEYDDTKFSITFPPEGEEILNNVTDFAITKYDTGTCEIAVSARPKNVGNTILNPITVINKFIPRYMLN